VLALSVRRKLNIGRSCLQSKKDSSGIEPTITLRRHIGAIDAAL
jgi:hypothetical protein